MAILGLLISCKEFDDFIVSYLDNTLPSGQQFLFKTHIWLCPTCRRYLEHYKQTISISQTAFKKSEEPRQVPDELVNAILAAKRAAQSQPPDQQA